MNSNCNCIHYRKQTILYVACNNGNVCSFNKEYKVKLPIKEYLLLKETTGYHLAKELGISPSRVGHWTKKDGVSGAETMIHFTRAGVVTHVVRELTVHPREGMM